MRLQILNRKSLKNLYESYAIGRLIRLNQRPPPESSFACCWVVSKYAGNKVPSRILVPLVVSRARALYKMKAYEVKTNPSMKFATEFSASRFFFVS